ncbi:hypothetical protein [Nostoc sp. UHCC 0870]|uniref:hypothetical protein n=1 Tax=Nostoc sp. UHCC 0870 TaxID=2914041 RepID=UPI001EE0BD15|nr:hypothetical protein [Nostoc sp. UHCC 0870]UKO96864.1 hypothetical protein L6494_19965 [Nostoc sp. UHCC 0870]
MDIEKRVILPTRHTISRIKHPLWKQLNAVQAGKVYKVENSYWGGSGYIAANLVLDDLFKYLVK